MGINEHGIRETIVIFFVIPMPRSTPRMGLPIIIRREVLARINLVIIELLSEVTFVNSKLSWLSKKLTILEPLLKMKNRLMQRTRLRMMAKRYFLIFPVMLILNSNTIITDTATLMIAPFVWFQAKITRQIPTNNGL